MGVQKAPEMHVRPFIPAKVRMQYLAVQHSFLPWGQKHSILIVISSLVMNCCIRGCSKTSSHFSLIHRRNFATGGRHSWLWPKAKTSLKSQDPYSRPKATMIACGQRPQGSKSHRCVIYFLYSPWRDFSFPEMTPRDEKDTRTLIFFLALSKNRNFVQPKAAIGCLAALKGRPYISATFRLTIFI